MHCRRELRAQRVPWLLLPEQFRAARIRSMKFKVYGGSSPVRPNPSLKRSANGRPAGPGLRYGVHFLSPGPAVLPLSPA